MGKIEITPQWFQEFMWGFSFVGEAPSNAYDWTQPMSDIACYALTFSNTVFRVPRFFSILESPANAIEAPFVQDDIENIGPKSFAMYSLGGGVVHVEETGAIAAVLLPGIPSLGMGAHGTVVAVDSEGEIQRVLSDSHMETLTDPDLIILNSVLTGN